MSPTNGPPQEEPEPPEPASQDHRQPDLRYVFVARNEHERIQAAVAQAIAAKGFEATTIHDICAAGEISEETFYGHFTGKLEAVVAALEVGADQLMAHCQDAFDGTPTWPEGIWEGLRAYTDWMATNPAFARLALVEILAAGPAGQDLVRSLLDAFALFLTAGYGLEADTASARHTDEQVTGSVFALVHAHILREPPETLPTILPELVLATLTPFLGSDAASAFVTERAQRRSD